jgi:ATP-dependent DNA ligase
MASKRPLIYYTFDVMVLVGENMMGESLETRRNLLEDRALSEPIRFSPELDANLPALIQSVKSPGIRGPGREEPEEPL